MKRVYAGNIRVGGFSYGIYLCKIKPDRKDFEIVGRCDWEKREISIDASNMVKEEVYYTLFHELVHAAIEATLINYKLQNVQDDSFILPFTRILWDAMVGAGLIVERWEKKIKKRTKTLL